MIIQQPPENNDYDAPTMGNIPVYDNIEFILSHKPECRLWSYAEYEADENRRMLKNND